MTDAQREIISLLQQIKAAASVGATAVWGAITGTLSNQTDLQTALGNKIATSYLDPDATLAADSNDKIATQRATKAYVDASIPTAPSGGVIGTGFFDPTGGSITDPAITGVVTGVTYNAQGIYDITFVEQPDMNFQVVATAENNVPAIDISIQKFSTTGTRIRVYGSPTADLGTGVVTYSLIDAAKIGFSFLRQSE